MAVFLKERVPESVEEMVRLSEQYMEAHVGTTTQKTTKSFQKQKTEHKTDPNANRKARDWQERRCVLCHRTGHIAKGCKSVKPHKPQQKAAGGVPKGSREQLDDSPATQERSAIQQIR